MKILSYIILAVAAACITRAAPFDFIKVGESYTISFGLVKATITVVSDAGGGWFKCSESGKEATYVNFNQVVEISHGRPQSSPSIVSEDTAFTPKNYDKIKRGIVNNLTQLSLAAQQYCLEHGVVEVKATELIGPDKYVKELRSYDGETYDHLVIRLGRPISVLMSGGIEVRVPGP